MTDSNITVKIIIRGIEYTAENISMMMLVPMQRFTEDPSKVTGWEGIAYSLSQLCNFDPPFPDNLAWHYHIIDKNGEERKRYGMRLNEDEVFYIIQSFIKVLKPDDPDVQKFIIESKPSKGFGKIESTQSKEKQRQVLMDQLLALDSAKE